MQFIFKIIIHLTPYIIQTKHLTYSVLDTTKHTFLLIQIKLNKLVY